MCNTKQCAFCKTSIIGGESAYIAPNGDMVHEICLIGYVIENFLELGFKKEETEDGDVIRID